MIPLLLQVGRQAADVWVCSLACSQDDDNRVDASGEDGNLTAGLHSLHLQCSRCGGLCRALQACSLCSLTVLLCWPSVLSVETSLSMIQHEETSNAAARSI